MSYLSRITKSKDEQAKAVALRAAKSAAQQITVDIMSTENSLGEAKDRLELAKESNPFNAGNVIALQRTVANLEEDLAALKKLKEEEFSDAN